MHNNTPRSSVQNARAFITITVMPLGRAARPPEVHCIVVAAYRVRYTRERRVTDLYLYFINYIFVLRFDDDDDDDVTSFSRVPTTYYCSPSLDVRESAGPRRGKKLHGRPRRRDDPRLYTSCTAGLRENRETLEPK